jgi:hypothetical protein
VEVAFEHIESPDEKAFFSDLGTNFDLDPYEVDCLVDRGARLLREATFIEPTGRGFTSFVSDDLKKGTMSRPPGPSPACTKKDGEGRIAVRNHYMDIGFQLGASLPGSNDVDDAKLNAGVTFKVTRPHGWGVVVDVGPQSFPIVTDLGGARTPLGDLRLWSFMGGIGRTRVMRRAEATLGVSAGFGLGSFVVSPEAGDTFGRDADASSTWLVKPQASFWYSLTNRWAATISASYVFSRPTIRITSTDGTAFDRRVDAAAFRVGAGIGIKIF